MDNRGTVNLTWDFPGFVNDVGQPTRRSHDAIFSVFESLSVVTMAKNQGNRNMRSFEQLIPLLTLSEPFDRCVFEILPDPTDKSCSGPNMLISMQQDQRYSVGRSSQCRVGRT